MKSMRVIRLSSQFDPWTVCGCMIPCDNALERSNRQQRRYVSHSYQCRVRNVSWPWTVCLLLLRLHTPVLSKDYTRASIPLQARMLAGPTRTPAWRIKFMAIILDTRVTGPYFGCGPQVPS